MISVQLPDGSKRQFEGPVTVAEVAASIGAGLAKAALAGRVGQGADARVVDTSYRIDHDMPLAIVTEKDADGLEVIRHSTAHLLAYAVKELFPEAQVTIGPVIENGFFYDFSYKRPFTPEDLTAIEAKMTELAVITLLGFFEHVQVLRQILLRGPGRAIDALQHLVAVVTAPVGTGHLHQLEVPEPARARHMRAAAQVFELTFAVQRHVFVRRDAGNDLGLVVLAQALEVRDGLVAR